MGWYVKFEQPVVATSTGLWSKDLVLDLLIAPEGTASPMDEADFDENIDRGIVPGELRATFADETDQVLAELAEKSARSPGVRVVPTRPRLVPPVGARRSRDYKGVLAVIESP